MSIKKITILVFVSFLHFTIIAQELDTIVLLDDVELTVKKDKFLVGSKIETIDSLRLSHVSGGTLTDMINRNLPIYIKQDAGGLSTIRFRGTSPDHTAIMFGGLNINSLTLGHSNMSNIPVFLFDDVKIQFGSSSSLYGTDAIGGSIQLDNKPRWNHGLSALFQQDIGSFGSYFTGGKFDYSNAKIHYGIKAFYQQKENDFPFLNIAVKDFEKDEYVNDVQKNAAIKNYGILQEFNYKISDNFFFFTKKWYQYNWHEIQPNMSSNYYGADYKEIENKNLRIVSGLNYNNGKHKVSTSFGYVYDYQLYNNTYDQIISTQSFISNINYFNSDLLFGKFNIGINYSHLTSDVYAYADKINEDRFDFFSSYKVKLVPKLTMAVNLRESVVLDYTNQFSPSLGFDYLILETSENTLRTTASIAKSFKIPTFNDRFWNPGGNPDLLPENGMNYEIGEDFIINKEKKTSTFGVSFFLMNVDNWIQWVPSGAIWSPVNLKMVQSFGTEFSFDKKCELGAVDLNWGVNYSYTDVSNVDDFWSFNFSDRKQLSYTPKYIANIYTGILYKKWYFNVNGSYTGIRYTTGKDKIEAYLLANTIIGRNI
ncbi:MAG: hypothetical protein DSY82_09380, partial [Flavobacteriia bacterium]